MTALRRVAASLLRAVAARSPATSRQWANAMLRELDFIRSDWAAVFWMLGGIAAICRHSGSRRLLRLQNQLGLREAFMNLIQKRALGLVSGIGIALVLAVAALALLHLSAVFVPFTDPERMPRLAWLLIVALPETACIVAVAALWRKRRPMALGVLLSAVVLATHFAIHIATHGIH